VARELNIYLLRVPPGFTWACQPADLSWNKPLKDRLRGKWVASLYGQLVSRTEGVPFTCGGPKRDDVVGWVVDAWGDLTRDTVVNGFAKAKLLPTSDVDMACLVDDSSTSEEDEGDEDYEAHGVDEDEGVEGSEDEDEGRAVPALWQIDDLQVEEELHGQHEADSAVEAVVSAMVQLSLVSRTEIFTDSRDIVMAHGESMNGSSI